MGRIAHNHRTTALCAIGLLAIGLATSCEYSPVGFGSSWQYLAGSAPSGWTGRAFDDSGWKTGDGALGFGNGGEGTVIAKGSIAYYFRRRFSVATPTALASATLRLIRDDGAVVYLNGVEVARSNMPAGAVSSTTLAASNVASDEGAIHSIALPTSALREGDNVLAVEVHQAWRDSSDVLFDAAVDLVYGDDSAEPPTTATGWKLHWADEFDGAALNTSVWKPYHNTYGDGNNELQCLTPNNVKVGGGVLTITAKRETVTCPNGQVRKFTSGFLGTRETGHFFPRYGRYEMRAKVPHAHALWPAFWLRHRDGSAAAEIDVMEYFHAQLPGRTTSSIHYNYVHGVAKGTASFETPTLSPGWHTWAVEIEPVNGKACIKYFVDDAPLTFHGQPAGAAYCVATTQFDKYPGQGLFDIAVNMAIGGDWIGDPDGPTTELMNGEAAASDGVLPTSFPTNYVVDYVRVFTR